MHKSAASSLACIIVHYGDPALTTACVASLLAGTRIPRIIVVSNTDSAGTQALQQRLQGFVRGGIAPAAEGVAQLPLAQVRMVDEASAAPVYAVQLIPLGGNKGFACACNAGMRLAQHYGDIRFIWLLNNDTTVAADAAEYLLSCLDHNPQALCGTAVLRADAPETLELALGCRFCALTTRITPCHAHTRWEEVPSAPQVDYVYGASMAFPLSLVDMIGFLDEQYFLYYEEHDFCVRAKKAGYAFHWCREARVWHGFAPAMAYPSPLPSPLPSSLPSFLPSSSRDMRAFKHFHETRSTVLFLRKHYPLLLLFAVMGRSVAKIFCLWRRGQMWLLTSYCRGIVAGLARSRAK